MLYAAANLNPVVPSRINEETARAMINNGDWIASSLANKCKDVGNDMIKNGMNWLDPQELNRSLLEIQMMIDELEDTLLEIKGAEMEG